MRLLMVMNPAVGHTGKQRPKLAAYNQMYRDVARVRSFQLIDHYPAWEKLLNDDPGMFLFYVPDTIHPVRIGAMNVITPTMVEALGLKPGMPELNPSAPCWVYLFRILMDKDRNGEVTREEFNNDWANVVTSGDESQNGRLVPDEFGPSNLFRHLDANRDGEVVLDEFQKVYAPHFDTRDKNKDDVLTQGELPERAQRH